MKHLDRADFDKLIAQAFTKLKAMPQDQFLILDFSPEGHLVVK